MGRIGLFILLGLFWGCNVQPPASVFLADPTEQVPAAPQAEVPSSAVYRHDFGIAKPSSTLAHDFVIENKSQADWTLAGVKTDCTCTIATPDWKTIPAGQARTVAVQLKTGSAIRFQPIVHAVEVQFREQSVAPVRLTVRALVRDVLYITPERVVLADVGKGTIVTRPIVVANFGPKAIAPPILRQNVSWITAKRPVEETLKNRDTSDPLQTFRYDIDLNTMSLALGHHDAQISFETDSITQIPSVAVSVDIRPSITAIPSRAFFGRIAPEGSGQLMIVVRSPENSALDKSKIRIETEFKDQMAWVIEKQSANSARINLTFTPIAADGLVHGEISILYDDSRISLPVDALIHSP